MGAPFIITVAPLRSSGALFNIDGAPPEHSPSLRRKSALPGHLNHYSASPTSLQYVSGAPLKVLTSGHLTKYRRRPFQSTRDNIQYHRPKKRARRPDGSRMGGPGAPIQYQLSSLCSSTKPLRSLRTSMELLSSLHPRFGSPNSSESYSPLSFLRPG